MKEFFGFGGYTRLPEGYMSWQHLLFVSSLMAIMITLAIIFGRKFRNETEDKKNKVLIWAAILIDSLEIFKIILMSFRGNDPLTFTRELPLYLCSIQLITIPLAAFSHGRIREAALDFVFIFGILGAVFGTYFAGQNYGCYPVLSFDNVISGITHSISGFASLYIAISNSASMKKRNIYITFIILFGFCISAYIVNQILDTNYMFLMRGDGTPYDILYNLTNGGIIYSIGVVLLFVLYITAFNYIFNLIKNRNKKTNE